MTIAAGQRFTRNRPCPICQGYDNAPRGRGVRCFGFISDDGKYAYCTREDTAGEAEFNRNAMAYPHRLDGRCKCGIRHGISPDAPARRNERSIADTGSLSSRRAPPSRIGTWDRAYTYVTEHGEPIHRTVRFHPKSFRQQRYDAGEWRWGLGQTVPVLYRLPTILAAPADEPIFLCEGEKDADTLAALGLVATTNAMGSKHWRSGYNAALRDRRVVVLIDNDAAGQERRWTLDHALSGEAALAFACFDLFEGSDVTDWLESGRGSAERLRELAAGCRRRERAV